MLSKPAGAGPKYWTIILRTKANQKQGLIELESLDSEILRSSGCYSLNRLTSHIEPNTPSPGESPAGKGRQFLAAALTVIYFSMKDTFLCFFPHKANPLIQNEGSFFFFFNFFGHLKYVGSIRQPLGRRQKHRVVASPDFKDAWKKD